MQTLRKNSIYVTILSILLSQIFIPKMSFGEVFNVSNESELRQALATADSNGDNDIINIAAGTYDTGGTPFLYEAEASENFSVALIGAGSGITILDGADLDRVLIINTNNVSDNSDTDITIRSITIQNGDIIGTGGGISIISKSPNAKIENCEFTNNNASTSGGGASISAESLVIMNSKFTNNTADTFGGGALVSAESVALNDNAFMSNSSAGSGGGINIFSAKTTTLSNNIFENNSSIGSDGGGTFIDSQNVSLSQNNIFNNNSAQNDGGAVYAAGAVNANFLGNLFENNMANQNGGGSYIKASSQITMSNNTFNGNGAGLDGGGSYADGDGNVNLNANLFMNNVSNRNGGGASVDSNNGILTNNIFIKNGSINSGGAAYLTGPVSNTTNNTMTLNSTAGNGGGLAVDLPNETDTANIYNNIIFNNTSQTSGQDDIFVDDDSDRLFSKLGSFVNLFNNDFTEFFSSCENLAGCNPRVDRGNNIDADPSFVDADAGDVNLTENSPAIDAGDPDAPDIPPADFDGNPRIQGPAPDMGALEFVGPPPPVDVLIEKTANVIFVPPNRESEIMYTIKIENIGEENATEVSVQDNLPKGSTIESLTPGCAEAQSGIVTCQVGTLLTGEERAFEITITITPNAQTVVNQAIVNFENRVKMVSLAIPVVSAPNVSIEKSSNVSTVRRGRSSQITYTIRIESDGDDEARDVVVTDDLPEGSTLAEASQGCLEENPGTVVCDVGNLPQEEERVLSLTIDITPQAASIINQAIVEFLGGQNSDSFTIGVTGGEGEGGGGCSMAGGQGQSGSLSTIVIILLLPLLLTGLRLFRKKLSR